LAADPPRVDARRRRFVILGTDLLSRFVDPSIQFSPGIDGDLASDSSSGGVRRWRRRDWEPSVIVGSVGRGVSSGNVDPCGNGPDRPESNGLRVVLGPLDLDPTGVSRSREGCLEPLDPRMVTRIRSGGLLST
jgi:hypothetical protein